MQKKRQKLNPYQKSFLIHQRILSHDLSHNLSHDLSHNLSQSPKRAHLRRILIKIRLLLQNL